MSAANWWVLCNAIGNREVRFSSRDDALASIADAVEIDQDEYMLRLTPTLSNELQRWIICARQDEMDVWLRERYDAIGYAETYTLQQREGEAVASASTKEADRETSRPVGQATRHVMLLPLTDHSASPGSNKTELLIARLRALQPD